MHSLGYDIEGERCRVHFDGDCEGEAIFTLIEDNERVFEHNEDIRYVEDAVILAENVGSTGIIIGNQRFNTEEMSNLLATMAERRIQYLMEDVVYSRPFKEVRAMEQTIKELVLR